MKRIMGKLKQALSIVLAVAMIVTCLPQTGISVMAAEDQSAESSDEPDVSIETAEDEKNDSNESAPAGDEADEPEEADTEDEAEAEENEAEAEKETEENGIMTLNLTATVKAAEDAESYSVDPGDLTDGKQYFTVTVDSGYMISPEEGAVTATKNGKTATVNEGNGEDEYYVTVDETDGEVEIVVTVKVVKTFTVTIKIADAADTDGLVKNIMYTTAAAPGDADWKKLETEGVSNLMEILKSGDDFKIKFELKENYKAEVKAGVDGKEKAVTPESGVYTVKNITADTNVIIAAAPIQYTIDTVITVDGKNVTAAEIEEIKEEIKEETGSDILVTGYEVIEFLQKGENLELSLASGDLVYYIESVKCKVGSTSEKMTYGEDDDPDKVKYELKADKIAEVFPNLQDDDTITVVINMEKAWKVTFNLEGVTVQDARSINADGWYEIDGKEPLYVRKGSSLALTAERNADTGNDVQLQEAWYQTGTKKTDIKDKIDGKKFSVPITADTIVTIKSIAEKYYNLAFNNEDSEIITVSEKKLGNAAISDDNINIKEGTVTSKNKITFKAAAEKGYKPVVTVEERRNSDGSDKWVTVKTLTPTKAGVYELTSLTADSRITIDKALDEKLCNVLYIDPEREELSNAYTATLTMSGKDVLPVSKNKFLVPLEEAEAVLTIDLKSGYEKPPVVKLKVGNEKEKILDVTGNDPAGYTITFKETREVQNIIVSAEEEAATADTTVRFANTAPHMSYKVATTKDGPVTQVTDGKVSNTYKISKEGRSIRFTVTTANAYYRPVVTINNGTDPIDPISVDTKKRTYTYSIAVKNIISKDNSGIVYIQETSDEREILVWYDKQAVEVSADIGGGTKNEDSNDGNGVATYFVTDGDTINFKVSVKNNYKLDNITAKNLKTGKETKVTKNNISVKADTDYLLIVYTRALTAINVYKVESEDDEAKVSVSMNKNKTYSVQGGTDYVIEVKNGAEKADLKYAYFPYGTKSTAEVKNGTVTVKMNRADADIKKAKQLTLTLKDANKNPYTVTLELLPLAGVKKVDGVKTGKTGNILTQTVNTTKSYAITMDPATAAVTLGARPVGEEDTGVTAKVEGRMLEITTATDLEKDKLAKFELFDTTEKPGEEKALYEFYVTTKKPTLPTPTVALQSADDTTLMLTLGAKNLALPDEGRGNVYYKVEVKADANATAKLSKDQRDKLEGSGSVTKYFAIAEVDSKGSTSQTEEVKVINADFGEGFANTFDVTVTLVQSKSEKTISQLSEETEANKLIESKKSVTKKGLKTKAPAYATKITFKKGASAVYTNQKNVLAATAVFDKNATYTTLIDENGDVGAPVDTSYTGDKADQALEISIKGGSQILVSATSKTAPGKHVIRVTADNRERGADKMRQTTADYTVTVERAIEDIKLDAPTVYKAAGKAASFTVGITYNKGTTQPKAKKVTWTITDASGNDLSREEARGVTVKNGKVTIPKDYILKQSEDDEVGKCDFVYVTATAADVTANLAGEPVKETAEVYISNQAESVGETILVKGIGEPTGGAYKQLKVIARSGETVTAEQLKGARIAVLKKGAVDKDIYGLNELFNESVGVDMTYKVSNKAIVLEGEVIKEVNGGNLKNVTITATTADGSNLKSELKNLTVSYYEPEEYGLAVKQMTPWESENVEVLYKNNSSTYTEYYFNGALDTIFEFQVKEKQKGEWTELSAVSNYTLAVTGASILEKDVVRGTYTIICSKDKIEVKLTDKAKNNVTTYTFHNRAVSTAKAPTLKALTKGDLIAGTYNGSQQIRYNLNGFNGDKQNSFVLITLDAKDSTNKKNEARYKEFEKYCSFLNNTSYTVEQLEQLGLVFGNGYTNIPAGTYKLTVNFGKINNDFNFVATTKPVSLTVKASAPKISAKLNSDYTLSINNAAAGAALKLNNDKAVLKSVELVNDNVNGKENHFTDYFEIKKKDGGTFVLKLKDNLTIDDLIYIKDTKKAKNDLTGWVTYTYDNGISETELQAQIRVKSYAEPKYTMDSGKVLRDENMTIELAVRAGNNTIEVAHAYSTTDALKVTGIGAAVKFKVTGTGSKKDVYIVPKTSACVKVLDDLKAAIDGAEDKENAEKKYDEAVKAFGAKVTVTVTVVDKLPERDPFMKFRYKEAEFSKNSYGVDDYPSPGHTPDYKGRYEVVFPFTKNITEAETPEVRIKEIAAGKTPLGSESGLLEVGMIYDQSLLYFHCVKEELAKLVAEGKVSYGEPLTVTILITHQNGLEEPESFTFTVFLPQNPAMTAKEQIDTVSGNAAQMKDEVIVLKDWQAGAIKEHGGTPNSADLKQLRRELYSDNVKELDDIIIRQNQEWDSGIWFKLPHWVEASEWDTFVEESFGDDEGLVTLPTSEEEGSIRYTITWENTEAAPDSGNRTGTFVVERRIAKLPAAPEDLKDEFEGAIEAAQNSLTLTDKNQSKFEDMLEAEIIKVLLENAETKEERKHLRVNVGVLSVTSGDQPGITYGVELRDIKYGGKIDSEAAFALFERVYGDFRIYCKDIESWAAYTQAAYKEGVRPAWMGNDLSEERTSEYIEYHLEEYLSALIEDYHSGAIRDASQRKLMEEHLGRFIEDYQKKPAGEEWWPDWPTDIEVSTEFTEVKKGTTEAAGTVTGNINIKLITEEGEKPASASIPFKFFIPRLYTAAEWAKVLPNEKALQYLTGDADNPKHVAQWEQTFVAWPQLIINNYSYNYGKDIKANNFSVEMEGEMKITKKPTKTEWGSVTAKLKVINTDDSSDIGYADVTYDIKYAESILGIG